MFSFLDEEGGRVDEGPEQLGSPALEEALNRSPGDPHLAARLVLLETLQVADAHGLQLAQVQADGLELRHGDTPGLPNPIPGVSSAITSLTGSWHDSARVLFCSYAQNIGRMGVCQEREISWLCCEDCVRRSPMATPSCRSGLRGYPTPNSLSYFVLWPKNTISAAQPNHLERCLDSEVISASSRPVSPAE
jgi:hypothetical protein